MKFLTAFGITSLFLFASCDKEELNGFDNDIGFAQDFAVDPVSGDTIYSFLMPNGFTPNNDGLNDNYRVYGTGIDGDNFSMTIFARNGNTVHYDDDFRSSWSGAVQGDLTGLSVFTVAIELRDTAGNFHSYQYDIAQSR